MVKYLKLWWLLSKNQFLTVLYRRVGFIFFLFGKLLRFFFYLLFLIYLLKGSHTLAGYNLNETLFFFLTFSLIDTTSQFLFRNVYSFRPLIISGNFDLILTKPVNALFTSLLSGADLIDLVTLPPLIAAVIYVGSLLHPSLIQIIFYILLVINGLLLATAFHIAVLSWGIISLEVDHTIMIYRDLTSLAKFPIDIYKEPLRTALTFFIPIGVMITVPAKAIMGLISPLGVLWSLIFGIGLVYLATRFWHYALRKYTSASS